MQKEEKNWADLIERIGMKKIAIFFGIVFLGLIIYALASYMINKDKISVKIQFAPYEAIVKIDDEVVKNNEKNNIEIGEHIVTVKFENFEDYEQKIDVDENTEYIGGMLTAINEEGRAYIMSHRTEFDAVVISVEGDNDLKRQNIYEKLVEKVPVVRKLPFSNALFSINYLLDEEKPTLTILATNTYMDVAVAKLKSLISEEENLAKYNIEFSSFDNPLEKGFVKNAADNPKIFLENGYKDVKDFTVEEVKEEGDYYYAVVTTGLERTYSLVHYKVIMKKDGEGRLTLIDNPEPILTIYNTTEVPEEILSEANKL